uniref:Fibrinogen C-terminal domain-containing protein n=1 Tax=Amphimedon queenslandica TaxID=400682 RepID=A0A1X7TKV0_AMPQE
MPGFILANPGNEYEMLEFSNNASRSDAPPTEAAPKQKSSQFSAWSRPLVVITVLLCLIVFLLLVILCLLLVLLSAKDANCTCTTTAGAISGNFVLPNFTKWSDNIVNKLDHSLPDFNEWANGVVSKVNSNVTQSLPNFNEWANSVVSKVNSNVTQSLPDFNEWADSVVSKVNSKVTQSLPDFNEWADGVAQNTFQLLQSSPNLTELNEQILQTTRNSAARLMDIVNTLSNLEDTSTSTAGVVDDILLIAQELLVLQSRNESTTSDLPTSCKEIKERQPLSPSGLYLLSNSSSTYTAYCNMEELCNSAGGWTRLAYLNMTDSTVNCPSGFRLYQSGGVRACGRPVTSSGSCVSVQIPSHDISYSQVCGRVTGYQYSSPDAVDNDLIPNSYHIWTLMAANYEQFGVGHGLHVCPCATGSTQSVQSFVSDHYFCESGISDIIQYHQQLYISDPLWDGQGCGFREAPCCNAPGIPWFHRDYGSNTTTDNIELRVYGDEGTAFVVCST